MTNAGPEGRRENKHPENCGLHIREGKIPRKGQTDGQKQINPENTGAKRWNSSAEAVEKTSKWEGKSTCVTENRKGETLLLRRSTRGNVQGNQRELRGDILKRSIEKTETGTHCRGQCVITSTCTS